jgi:mono/diheme cytochrome c family protein
MSAEPGIWFALSSRMQPRKFNDGKRLASNVRYVRLLLVALWLAGLFTTLAIPMSRASAQQDVDTANRAFDILSRRCFQCHGANGIARKHIFVLDRERLVSSGVVVPGDPNSLLLKLVDKGEMPLGAPELPPEEKAVLRKWVAAGAPGWPNTVKPNRQFLAESGLLQLIRSDLLNAPERSRPFLRYLSLVHLYNSGASQLPRSRKTLSDASRPRDEWREEGDRDYEVDVVCFGSGHDWRRRARLFDRLQQA